LATEISLGIGSQMFLSACDYLLEVLTGISLMDLFRRRSVFNLNIERIGGALSVHHPSRDTFQRMYAGSVTLFGCDNSKLIHLVEQS
jgi:hypothetical protein